MRWQRWGMIFTYSKTCSIQIGVIVLLIYLVWYSSLHDMSLEKIQKACSKGQIGSKIPLEMSGSSDTSGDISNVVAVAKAASMYNGAVLVSIVNDAFLPFAYSWLCNTKDMNIHRSVLVITTDDVSKQRLNQDWPDINVVKLNLKIPRGNQEYSKAGYVKIMIRRTELLLELLQSDLEILLLEFDYMWFENPLPKLQLLKGVDFLINPVSSDDVVYNGGFLYMFPTDRSKALWKKLTEMMQDLEKQIEKKPETFAVSSNENDQVYFTSLLKRGFANVRTQELPLHAYADGQWYTLTENERSSRNTLVISNNFVIGNLNKMKRAQKWDHWFLHDNCTCNYELVLKMVHR